MIHASFQKKNQNLISQVNSWTHLFVASYACYLNIKDKYVSVLNLNDGREECAMRFNYKSGSVYLPLECVRNNNNDHLHARKPAVVTSESFNSIPTDSLQHARTGSCSASSSGWPTGRKSLPADTGNRPSECINSCRVFRLLKHSIWIISVFSYSGLFRKSVRQHRAYMPYLIP